MQPVFSIILPTYNRAQLLPTAINSVIGQEYSNWELIVIDDGSTDNTQMVVKKIDDNRIKYYYQENQERSIARNNGVIKANAPYICFLDSDDYYLPNHLSRFFQAIESKNWPSDELFVSGMKGKTAKGWIEIPLYNAEFGSPVRFFWKNGPSVNIFCIPRKILLKTTFPEHYHLAEDLHLITRLLLSYPVNPIGSYTFVAVEHQGRSSNQRFRKNIEESLRSNISAIENILTIEQERLENHLLPEDIKNMKYQLFNMYANGAIKRGLPLLGLQLSWKMVQLRKHPSLIVDIAKLFTWQLIYLIRRALHYFL